MARSASSCCASRSRGRSCGACAGTRLRAVSTSRSASPRRVALVAIPYYLLLATAQFALRSCVRTSARCVPLIRASAFGRGFLDLELCFALFVARRGSSRSGSTGPSGEQRSIAELLAFGGRARGRGRRAARPGRRRPRGADVAARPLARASTGSHLAAGSIWLGGLIGLLVLGLDAAGRRCGARASPSCVPRFSNVALRLGLLLLGSGIWAAFEHLPTLASLWETVVRQALILEGRPAPAAIAARRGEPARRAAAAASRATPSTGRSLLRRLVSGEILLVAAAIIGGALLSSLPPPAKALAPRASALAQRRARARSAHRRRRTATRCGSR